MKTTIILWRSEQFECNYGYIIYELPDGEEIKVSGATVNWDFVKWMFPDAQKIGSCSDVEMLKFVKSNFRDSF